VELKPGIDDSLLARAVAATPVPSDLPPMEDADLGGPYVLPPRESPQPEPQPEEQPAPRSPSTSPVSSQRRRQERPESPAAGSPASAFSIQRGSNASGESRPASKSRMKSFVGEAISAPKSSKSRSVVGGFAAITGSKSGRSKNKPAEVLTIASTKTASPPLCTYEYVVSPSRAAIAAPPAEDVAESAEAAAAVEAFVAAAEKTAEPSSVQPPSAPPPRRRAGLTAEASLMHVVTLSTVTLEPVENIAADSVPAKAWQMRPSVGTWLLPHRSLKLALSASDGGHHGSLLAVQDDEQLGREDLQNSAAMLMGKPVLEDALPVVEPMAVIKEQDVSKLENMVRKTTSDSTPSIWTQCPPSDGSPADGTCTPQSSSSFADLLPEAGGMIAEAAATDESTDADCMPATRQHFERLPSVGTWLVASSTRLPEEGC